MTLARGLATSNTAGRTTGTFLRIISTTPARQRKGETYVLAGIPRLAISATPGLDWAVSPLVVGITTLSELGVVRSEMFVVIEALLRLQVSVTVYALKACYSPRQKPWRQKREQLLGSA
jgi:hypothetical protein